jgi:hypothetical protein
MSVVFWPLATSYFVCVILLLHPESVKVLHVSKVSTIGGEFTPKYEVVLVKY